MKRESTETADPRSWELRDSKLTTYGVCLGPTLTLWLVCKINKKITIKK